MVFTDNLFFCYSWQKLMMMKKREKEKIFEIDGKKIFDDPGTAKKLHFLARDPSKT